MEIKIVTSYYDTKTTEIEAGALPEITILHDTYLERKWKYSVIEILEDGTRQPQKYIGNYRLLKNNVIGVSAGWDNNNEAFCVYVFTTNHKADFTLFYKTIEEVTEVANKIYTWISGK